jgi:cysteinyl-tRNA synthetase
MYTCGQTVYNDIHVGNARFYVVFDVVRRWLTHRGYDVNFVQNFTDVDDKIIARAADEGMNCTALAEKYIARTIEDLGNLQVLLPTVAPRATQEIASIITLIVELIEKEYAYAVGGTVYFRVAAFAGYGKLSRRRVEDMIAGARVEIADEKESPADFVLWKPAKPDEPAEAGWDSPWGRGRPGWHIECSAMIRRHLGDTIDIHGGGADLIFPHHENEIAQSEAACGNELARFWMHCGSVTARHKKVSKSCGNFSTLRDAAEKWGYDTLRFLFVSGHYRSNLEFTDEALHAAKAGLARIRTCVENLHDVSPVLSDELPAGFTENFCRAMDDDFNTADAVAAIFELVRHANKTGGGNPELQWMCNVLGIFFADTADNFDIAPLLDSYAAARAAKDWPTADALRDDAAKMGYTLEVTPDGVRAKRA